MNAVRASGLLLVALLFATLCLVPVGASAKEDVNRGGAAVGGAIAGLVCGGGTLAYAKLREQAGGSGPLLWHSGGGPGWVAIFFLEHAGVGGLTGAFGRQPRQGFLIGGVVTCTLDVVWIVSAEILAASARDDDRGLQELRFRQAPLGLAERGPDGWRLGMPPVILRRDGAWVSLFALRF